MWPSVKGLLLTAGFDLALLTHVAASACTGTEQIPGHEVAPPGQPSTVPCSQHGEGQPRTPFFWESHHKYLELRVLTECSGISKPREELVSIFLESGAVVTLRARVPGPQGQAVNPAPGGMRSISLHILPPHKCLFNSGLIPNNAAAPLKSPEMKTCETINPRLLGWRQRWKGFTGTMCFSTQELLAPWLLVFPGAQSQPDLPGSSVHTP